MTRNKKIEIPLDDTTSRYGYCIRLDQCRDRIVVDEKRQPREGMNTAHIAYLRDVLEAKRAFSDPIEAVLDPGTSKLFLFSGFHRFAATEGGRCFDVVVRVHLPRPGLTAQRDAFVRSLANPSSGTGATPETMADKRRRIRLSIEDPELGAMPNSELKRYLGVNSATLYYHRKELASTLAAPAL